MSDSLHLNQERLPLNDLRLGILVRVAELLNTTFESWCKKYSCLSYATATAALRPESITVWYRIVAVYNVFVWKYMPNHFNLGQVEPSIGLLTKYSIPFERFVYDEMRQNRRCGICFNGMGEKISKKASIRGGTSLSLGSNPWALSQAHNN